MPDLSTAERLKSLTSLTLKERAELTQDLDDEFQTADEADDTEGMAIALRGLERLDMFEELIAEIDDLDEEDTEDDDSSDEDDGPEDEYEDDERDEDDGDIEATAAEDDDEDDDGDGDGDIVDQGEGEGGEPTEAAPSTESESGAKEMAATVVTREELQPVAAHPAMIPVTASAGADVRNYVAGERFRNPAVEIPKAMAERIREISSMHGPGTKTVVASLRGEIPIERQLGSDPSDNMIKIEAVTHEGSPEALVASGGFCAPTPLNYDIFTLGSTARPVRDALPTFGATRGGIRFFPPPQLTPGTYDTGIALWTAENDENPSDPATKPVYKVQCVQPTEAIVDAIPLTLEFGNLMTRAFPELVQQHNRLALVTHARFAEKNLLTKISALSDKVTTAHQYGTVRDLLLSLGRAGVVYRNKHRVPRPVPLRAILPEWVRDALRDDLLTNFAQGTDDLAVADATIMNWFSERGLSPIWHMDDNVPAQTYPGALNDYPATVKYWLYTEGTLIFLDGGTLDLGVVRDGDLVSTNDYQTFVETFEGVAKVGVQVLEVTATTKLGQKPAA